jgi:hypothetical protein
MKIANLRYFKLNDNVKAAWCFGRSGNKTSSFNSSTTMLYMTDTAASSDVSIDIYNFRFYQLLHQSYCIAKIAPSWQKFAFWFLTSFSPDEFSWQLGMLVRIFHWKATLVFFCIYFALQDWNCELYLLIDLWLK